MATSATTSPQAELATVIAPVPLTLAPTDDVMTAIALMSAETRFCNFACELDGQARQRLSQAQHSCVLVKEGDRLVGIVTERDLVRLSRANRSLAGVAIADVMSAPVLTLNRADFTDIFVPLNLLQRHAIRHLPLVDQQGRVVGLLTHDSLRPLLHAIDLLHLPTAAEVMTAEVVHVPLTATLNQLTQQMTTHRVSSVVIAELGQEHFTPIGIVTEHDIVQSLALALDFANVQAQTIMSTPVISVEGSTSLWDVRQQMYDWHINQVVVTDTCGWMVGIVTQTSLLSVLNPMAIYRRAEWLIQERTRAMEMQVERERLFTQIATQIRSSLSLPKVLDAAVTSVRAFLQCDRLLVYQFHPDWNGIVVAESVGEGWRSLMQNPLVDSYLQTHAQALYSAGRTVAIDNISTAGYTDCHLKLLEPYQVKANLVVPILVTGDLWGLLIGHQCAAPRIWQKTDLALLDKLGVQLAIAIQQATAYQHAQTELMKRKQVEAKLKASEERYRQIVETTLEGVWILDIENRTSYVNPRMAKMLGYSADEMLGKSLFDFMDTEEQAQATIKLERCYQDIQEQHDFRFKTKTGNDIWMLIATNLLYDDAGNYMGALGMLTDISDRKQTEAALIRSEAQSRAMLTAIPDLMFRISGDGVYRGHVTSRIAMDVVPQAFNPIGKFMAEFLPADLVERQQAAIQRVLATGEMQIYEQQVQVGDRLQEEEVRVVKSGDDEVLFMIRDISDRKRAAAEKLQSEKLRVELTILENILDTILAGYWDADLVNGIQYISPGFKSMFGYQDHELPNSPETWKTLVFPEDLPKAFEAYQNHVQSHGKIPYRVELRYRHKNGSTVWIICSGQVIEWDAAGNPLRLIGCHIDISDRKQAEAKLEQQAQREHLISAISQRIRASLNLSEILNTTVAEVHQVLQADRVLVYRVLPDGTGKTIAESVSPGWPIILDMIFPEEVFPRENYDRYVQGRIFALADRETVQILPCLADFLQNLKVRAKLVVPIIENNILWGLLIAHQCEGPRQWQAWEIDVLRQLSSQLAIAIQQSQLYAQLQDSHQQLSYTNAELIRATRLKDEFLANMSHELRTPLNAILGLSEGLLEEVLGTLSDTQMNAIATIERSGQHLLELINDILELSKIEAGKLELSIQNVSIAQVCKSSLAFVKQQAFKKQIQLNLTLAPDLRDIAIDERRMRQVLINLLTNAVKFTPNGGQVSLEVHAEPTEINLTERITLIRPPKRVEFVPQTDGDIPTMEQYLRISVIDTGIGISPADQARLFKPFVQVDSSLSRQYEGTGLGLALVKQIVELHGGEVSLYSEVERGSCFSVRLPYVAGPSHTQDRDSQSSDPQDRDCPNEFDTAPRSTTLAPSATDVLKTSEITPEVVHRPLILLAEDNEANVSTISAYLEAKGYDIVVANNGAEAIALTQRHHPMVILMDIQMPRVDGLEAIHTIRQDPQFVSVPIIALTALVMTGDREKCIAAGANEYLSKPVKLRQLDAIIQQFLEQSK